MNSTHRAARPRRGQALAMVAAAALLTAGPAAHAQTAATEQVQVRSFQVQGNTLLDGAAVQAALVPYTGARSLADLQRAAQAVQALYGQAGWAAVVVYVPPQPVADGVVTLNVVEGKVSQVQVQGNQRLSAQRVRAALPSLVEGATPRVRRIDAELQIANENPGRNMAVLLGPGAAPGEVQATVKVDEQPVHRFSASLDNSGNDRTGHYRLGLGWQHADLTGHDDQFSLNLLKKFKALFPHVPTKSGLMVGLGETDEEILEVMRDMRAHDIDMLTIGQYLAPSGHHLPVRRYVHPDTFKMFEAEAYKMGFTHAAVGAMVRSSYHADQQAHGVLNPASVK